jgi:orotate phosphoribosyltransferase
MKQYKKDFITAALDNNVLKFGDFTLKSGRKSPYFFNTGHFDSGSTLALLGKAYASAIVDHGLQFEILFGPAYKGIPIASAVAIAMFNEYNIDISFCFNRKEQKDHGEGGITFGADLAGRALIIDDVISAGTSVKESNTLISGSSAKLAGICVALDRQERGSNHLSAIQEVATSYDVPVISIISLADIIEFVAEVGEYTEKIGAIRQYQKEYGI